MRGGLAMQFKAGRDLERFLERAQRRADRHMRLAPRRRMWRGATEYEDKSEEVPEGRYFGVHIGAAVYMYLVEAALPQSNEQIRRGLARGGCATSAAFSSRSPMVNRVYNALYILRQRGVVERVDALSWAIHFPSRARGARLNRKGT
jgi:hypothetical protein